MFTFFIICVTCSFLAELCTGSQSSSTGINCPGGKDLPHKGGLLELWVAAVHGEQCEFIQMFFVGIGCVVGLIEF